MLKQGILNPGVNSLLSRVRHTNMLVIADAAFPFWPMIETVDLALTSGIPTIPQVLETLLPNFNVGRVYMAEEFLSSNDDETRASFLKPLGAIPVCYEAHEAVFKPRVPLAIGLIRTGDVTKYGNMILVSE